MRARRRDVLEYVIWQERHSDAIQFSIFDIASISTERNASRREFDFLDDEEHNSMDACYEVPSGLPSPPSTVLGRAFRVECELVNV